PSQTLLLSLHDALPICCVPIVDDDRLVGIVTRRDLLRVLRRTDREIAADLRRHLAMLGGPGRYTVSVREGEAIVIDQFDDPQDRSEEHTSELQSRENLV